MLGRAADVDGRRNHTTELHAAELLFDLDGTLIDSIPAVEDAWRQWAAAESIAVPSGTVFHGRTARSLVASMVPPERVEAALARLGELEQHSLVPVVMMAGARDLLATIPAGRWAIVTSAARPVAKARIAAAGVPLPHVLVSGDDVTHGKPHPEPFLSAQRRARSLHPALAVEDTVAGLTSARAAGCTTIGITGTATLGELLPHADAVIESLADLTIAAWDDHSLHLNIRNAVTAH